MKIVDLRSDTVTKPTEEMREAMAKAVVGDDVYGEDPTIKELERDCAALFKKEDALFVTSGIMGNQVSILSHTNRGDEVIFEEQSHIYRSEAGAYAFLSGLSAVPVKGIKGAMDPLDVQRAANLEEDDHRTKTGLICLENTHNFSGGNVISLDNMQQVYDFAKMHKIPVHLDGARVFNAAAYLGCPVWEITQYCDSVMACFSKGLCAPVGSIVAGDRAFIKRARKMRKILGGALRQSGVLAAPALMALHKMTYRLSEDRERALVLAKAYEAMGFVVDTDIHSNIVMVYTRPEWKENAFALADKLSEEGVLCIAMSSNKIRFVTHYYIGDEDIDYAIEAGKKVIKEGCIC